MYKCFSSESCISVISTQNKNIIIILQNTNIWRLQKFIVHMFILLGKQVLQKYTVYTSCSPKTVVGMGVNLTWVRGGGGGRGTWPLLSKVYCVNILSQWVCFQNVGRTCPPVAPGLTPMVGGLEFGDRAARGGRESKMSASVTHLFKFYCDMCGTLSLGTPGKGRGQPQCLWSHFKEQCIKFDKIHFQFKILLVDQAIF